MGRRKEMQGICNDLLDSFVSRYNDLDGYWALGKFQTFLQSNTEAKIFFQLTGTKSKNCAFPQTSDYYRSALRRHLRLRKIPLEWLASGHIKVRTNSHTELICEMKLTTELGKVYRSERRVVARLHNPHLEICSAGKHGPKNQKGQ